MSPARHSAARHATPSGAAASRSGRPARDAPRPRAPWDETLPLTLSAWQSADAAATRAEPRTTTVSTRARHSGTGRPRPAASTPRAQTPQAQTPRAQNQPAKTPLAKPQPTRNQPVKNHQPVKNQPTRKPPGKTPPPKSSGPRSRQAVAVVAACLAASGGVLAATGAGLFSGGGSNNDDQNGLASITGSKTTPSPHTTTVSGQDQVVLPGRMGAAAAVAQAGTSPTALATAIATAPGVRVPAQRPAPPVVTPPPAPPVVAAPAGDPFANTKFFVDPTSQAAQAAQAALGGDAASLTALRKVASGPTATWFSGTPTAQVQGAVAARTAQIRATGALPVYIAYNIPQRDCGGYSGGGASSPADYRTWIRNFAAGLGGSKAAIILEPDALAGLDCLSAGDQQTRYALLNDAVNVLSAAGASVYIDAGHSHWQSVATIAARLKQAGVANARGFSLNVSNFFTNADSDAYGDAVVKTLGIPTHFVVDSSRNGQGPGSTWCNPTGRGLGVKATAATGDPNADAFYWFKTPGRSDGSCNGGPGAGTWWNSYAIGLGERAAF